MAIKAQCCLYEVQREETQGQRESFCVIWFLDASWNGESRIHCEMDPA